MLFRSISAIGRNSRLYLTRNSAEHKLFGTGSVCTSMASLLGKTRSDQELRAEPKPEPEPRPEPLPAEEIDAQSLGQKVSVALRTNALRVTQHPRVRHEKLSSTGSQCRRTHAPARRRCGRRCRRSPQEPTGPPRILRQREDGSQLGTAPQSPY